MRISAYAAMLRYSKLLEEYKALEEQITVVFTAERVSHRQDEILRLAKEKSVVSKNIASIEQALQSISVDIG